MALKRQTAALEGLFQVRTMHVSLGKELMTRGKTKFRYKCSV